MEYVFRCIDNNSINAYMDSNKTIKINSTEDITLGYDTITLSRNYPPYEKYDTVVVNNMNVEDISGIRFVEDWYFDIKQQTFIKEVKAMGVLLGNYNWDGLYDDKYVRLTREDEYLAKTPAFWIFFD
jgi:hypothetical protein